MALADILLLQAWLGRDMSMVVVMTLHLGLALVFGALSWLLWDRCLSRTLASVAILVLFGPFGGLALMVIAPGSALSATQAASRSGRPAPAAMARDGAEVLFDQIRQGRRHPLPPDIGPGFLETFQAGTLQQQQNAIAAISRSYHPDMGAALSAALASPVPALRVQAAAVYAKLRGHYGSRAKDLLVQGDPAVSKATIQEVVDSGFVDRETCDRLLALTVGHEPHPSSLPSARSAFTAMPKLKRHACGGLA